MSPQRPASVTGAIWLLLGLVAWSGVTALLTAVFRDELVDAWAAGRADAGAVEPPAFVPVAVVLFVVFALLVLVLLVFLRDGHRWARGSLTAVEVLMAVATLAGLRTDPPALFLALSLVSLVLDVAAVIFLWHRDTTAYVSDAWLATNRRP